jgi:hypothetical protein
MLHRALRLAKCRVSLPNRLAANFAADQNNTPEAAEQKQNKDQTEPKRDKQRKFLFGISKTPAPPKEMSLFSNEPQEVRQVSKKQAQQSENDSAPGNSPRAQQKPQENQRAAKPETRKQPEPVDFKSKILTFPKKEAER